MLYSSVPANPIPGLFSYIYYALLRAYNLFSAICVIVIEPELSALNSFYSHASLWLLLLAVATGFGCDSTEPEVVTDYEIIGFYTAILEASQMDSITGKVSGVVLEEGDAVKYHQLALTFESKKNVLSSASGKRPVFPELFTSHVFSPVTSDSIAEISIFSNQDFDEEYRAGDKLNDKFAILADGIEQSCRKPQPISLVEFNAQPRQGRAAFTLLLKERPSLHTVHKFTVHYRKTDRSLYILHFPEVIVY